MSQHHRQSPAQSVPPVIDAIVNALRGFLIGVVELIPGVSGGTVALVVGVYERALAAISDAIGVVKPAAKGEGAQVGARFRALDWLLIIPAGAAMVVAVFAMAGPLTAFVTDYEQTARSLFFGMVAVSVSVPLSMVYRPDLTSKPWVWLLFVLGAVLAFIGTGFTAAPVEQLNAPMVFFAAMVAVTALMLPGLSGSFLLLALGLYAPVMGAVAERDWAVILTFVAGALLGVALFARVLRWLLEKHRTVALVTMAGLMVGSLRALWPWQDADANLLLPASGAELATSLFWVVVGAAVVGLMLGAERRLRHFSGTRHVVTEDAR